MMRREAMATAMANRKPKGHGGKGYGMFKKYILVKWQDYMYSH